MSVDLLEGLRVSRETLEKLKLLESLLTKWNRSINLVARSTIADVWSRHILDSAQLFQLGAFRHWADLGAGAGFPGLVVSVLAAEKVPEARITLVEIDQRKATFLREASRMLGVPVNVVTERIEVLAPLSADVISARALASLSDLLGYAARHMTRDGRAVFPKGAGWRQEIDDARKRWSFDFEQRPSVTDPAAVILTVKAIEHV